MKQDEIIDRLLVLVKNELESATEKFGSFNSAHEGYAVLKEEVDELWDAIKTKGTPLDDRNMECIQVAAMAVRLILDCGGGTMEAT